MEYENDQKIIIIENFVDPEDLKLIDAHARIASTEYEGGAQEIWKNRVHKSEVFEEENKEVFDIVNNKYVPKVKELIKENFGTEVEPAYEILKIPYIAVWRKGNFSKLHYDRNYVTAMIYINGDFDGGELFFEDKNLKIKPLPGMISVYSGEIDHSVAKVEDGVRFTIPLFFNEIEENFEDGDEQKDFQIDSDQKK